MLRFVLSLVSVAILFGLLTSDDCRAQCRASAGSQGCGVPTARVNAVDVEVANQLAQLSAQAFAPGSNSAPVGLPASSGLFAQVTAPASAQAIPGAAAAAASALPAASNLSATSTTGACTSGACAVGGGSLTLRQRLDLNRAQRNADRATRLAGRAASGGRLARQGSTRTSIAISSTSGS